MNSGAFAVQSKLDNDKTARKTLMIDIWLSVRQIYEIIDALPLCYKDEVNVVYFKERLEQIVDEIELLNVNNNKTAEENGKYARLYVELNEIKKTLENLFPKTNKLEFGNNVMLEDKYNDVSMQLEENNKLVNKAYENFKSHSDENRKYTLAQLLKPGFLDYTLLSLVISITAAATAPVYSHNTDNYSSLTGEHIYDVKHTNYSEAKKIIKIYDRFASAHKPLIEDESNATTLEEAIKSAEQFLRDYENTHVPTSSYDNPEENPYYYEVIYLDDTNPDSILDSKSTIRIIILLVLFFILESLSYLLTLSNDEDFSLLVTRIAENLKANIITKNDLKALLAVAKEAREKNSKLADELYTAIVEGDKYEDVDILYDMIQQLVNTPGEIIEHVKENNKKHQ